MTTFPSWDVRHAQSGIPSPDPFLVAAAPLFAAGLPGPVLDVACGLGQNTLWLAGLGLQTVGIDGSAEAVRRARAENDRRELGARFDVVTLEDANPFFEKGSGAWGGIIVFHFLDRSLFPSLESCLAPGGVLAYKTHLQHRLRGPHARPRRPGYLLTSGELLRALPRLTPLAYREWTEANGAFAGLVARRPAGHSR